MMLQRHTFNPPNSPRPIMKLKTKFFPIVGRALLLATLPVLAFQTGCAVITKSQKAEVASFAKVAANYGTLPGDSIRVYAEAARFNWLVNVSARNFESETARTDGWTAIGKALEVETSFKAAAGQADAALDILDDYSALLTRLSSDESTAALDKSTRDLGASIDKGIKTYNKTFGKDLSLIGGTVAAGIQGAGGLFIRFRQARLLKDTVLAADPVVASLSQDISTLMHSKVKGYLTNVNDQLENNFKVAAQRSGHLPLETIQQVARRVESTHAGQALAESAAKAADHLASSHHQLAQIVQKRQSLKQSIEEIQVAADEIKAAQKIRKDLSK